MAENKHTLTPEQVAANVAADHLRRQERAAEMQARRERGEYVPHPPTDDGVQVGGPLLSDPTLPIRAYPAAGLMFGISAYPSDGLMGIGERNKHILDTLKPGEPIVIFRAKDILSTMVLLHYQTLLEMYNPHAEINERMVEKIAEFRLWQQQNPDKVKIPD
jgi:hypothetical protein